MKVNYLSDLKLSNFGLLRTSLIISISIVLDCSNNSRNVIRSKISSRAFSTTSLKLH